MIKIENEEVVGWEHAIRGMRNPLNSWDKSDTENRPQDTFSARGILSDMQTERKYQLKDI